MCPLLAFYSFIIEETENIFFSVSQGLISKDFLVRNFGNGCFLSNPFYEPPPAYRPRPEDCYLCETVNSVDELSGVNFESIKVNYLDRGRPLIVTDAMDDWDSMRLGVGVEDVAKVGGSLLANLKTHR